MMDQAPDLDIAIVGGELADGTGTPRRRADIGIRGDRIVAVGELGKAPAGRVIDAAGRVVAPGFVDAHTHDDRALLSNPAMTMKVSQGVTTVVVGNCGISLSPLTLDAAPPPPLDLLGNAEDYEYPTVASYMDRLEGEGSAVNAAVLIGHSSLRAGAMDRLDRPATAAEIAEMRAGLEEGLAAGAIGLSTGLFYEPASSAPTEEIIELGRPLTEASALYVTHMRDEGVHIMAALEETFRIGRELGISAIISHHKLAGRENFGRSMETLTMIDAARETQPVAFDVYPYNASSTVLAPAFMAKADRIIVTWSKAMPEMAGRELNAIAAEMGVSREEAAERLQPAGAIYFSMDETDVRRILAYPHAMIGSDGLPHDLKPHPRLWGTFPRVLGHYARDEGLFSLEEAIRRMTSLTAARFGLKDRGTIAPGAFADIVVINPETVIDRASFDAPETPADGIDRVLVNGVEVYSGMEPTGARPGRPLRRAA